MSVSESLNAKATEAYTKVREQIGAYTQKGEDAFENVKENVKEKATDLQHKFKDAVEKTKDNADPYLKSTKQFAENMVESGKSRAQTVASTLHKGVERVNQIYYSQSQVFRVFSEVIAIFIFICWYILNFIPSVSRLIGRIYGYAKSVGIVYALKKSDSFIMGAVDYIPFIGHHLYTFNQALRSQVFQDVKSLISQSSLRSKSE